MERHLSAALSKLPSEVEMVSFQGHRLVLRMKAAMGTAERGHLLLDLEKRLHREIDPELTVFLTPTGDAEKLRIKLRGVKVK